MNVMATARTIAASTRFFGPAPEVDPRDAGPLSLGSRSSLVP